MGCLSLDWRLVRDLPKQGCEFFHPVDVSKKTIPEMWPNNSKRIVIEALVVSSNTLL